MTKSYLMIQWTKENQSYYLTNSYLMIQWTKENQSYYLTNSYLMIQWTKENQSYYLHFSNKAYADAEVFDADVHIFILWWVRWIPWFHGLWARHGLTVRYGRTIKKIEGRFGPNKRNGVDNRGKGER